MRKHQAVSKLIWSYETWDTNGSLNFVIVDVTWYDFKYSEFTLFTIHYILLKEHQGSQTIVKRIEEIIRKKVISYFGPFADVRVDEYVSPRHKR